MYEQTNVRGFTLIEVLIVVAIIGIVSAMILVTFSGRQQARNLERAAREVMATLREAQNYALSGRAGVISENNTYYGVDFTAGASYSVVSSGGTIESYSMKNGIVASAASSVRFMLPRGEVYIGGAALSGSHRITLANGALNHYICVYSTGHILDNGAAAVCP